MDFCVSVIFDRTENSSWFYNTQPQCSIRNMDDLFSLKGVIPETKPDYEFIYLPFLQIRNAKRARMYSTEILRGNQKSAIMGKAFLNAQRVMMKNWPWGSPGDPDLIPVQRIEKQINSLFMMVERLLDLLPLKTIDMLRLDRFSSWYTDKLHGNSPYENELKRLLLIGARGHDFLGTMDDRYWMMRVHNPLSLAYQTAFPNAFDSAKHPDIDAKGCNREAWHSVYMDRIPPLNSKETDKRYRKWSREYGNPENGGEFVILHGYFSLLTGRKPKI